MHEMGIANSVLVAVRAEVARYPRCVPQKVGLRIGELAAIDPEALRFCFDALIKDTDLRALKLEIELSPRRHRCRSCGQEFIVRNHEWACSCGSEIESQFIAGDELDLAYIEVEEHEPSAVGEKSSQ